MSCENENSMIISLCCAGVLEWQTGKTKDLVSGWACGFKSHLPQKRNPKKYFVFFRIFCYINTCILVHASFLQDFPASYAKAVSVLLT